MNTPKLSPTSSPEMPHGFSSREFINEMAAELQRWLDDQVLSGNVKGMEFDLKVLSSGGTQIAVQSLSAHGQSLVKIKGVLSDGSPCVFFAHQNSMQFLAAFYPRTQKREKRREVGFHTLIVGDKKIEPPAKSRAHS
jgi:hypothetical protein